MNPFKLFAYFMAGLALIFSSCSMQKRVYSKGYTIHWKKKQNTTTSHDLAQAPKPDAPKPQEAIPALAEAPAPAAAKTIGHENSVAAAALPAPKTAAASPSGFHKKARLGNNEKASQAEQKLLVKENQKKQSKSKRGDGGKSQIVALLLCIFLGLLGVHRFYLGYTGMGILYLFTAGIFGVGWIIDIILLIIPNGLTPKNKTNYDE